MTIPASETSVTSRFSALVKTTKFSWFVGHFTVVSATILYWLSLRTSSLTHTVYRLVFLGSAESFAVLVYQNVHQTKSVDLADILSTENGLYLLLSLLYLLISPRIPFATIPFFIISLFHVLTYVVTDFSSKVLLISDLKKHPILKFIESFVKTNHERSLNAICNSELLCLLYNLLRLIAFRQSSLIAFVGSFIFIRMKAKKSTHMVRCISQLEVRIDGLVSHPAVTPAIKTHYATAKLYLKRWLIHLESKKSV